MNRFADALNSVLDRMSLLLLQLSCWVQARADLVISVFTTYVFVAPMIAQGGRNAGFLYTGDVSGLYWPAMLKTISLLSSFNFTALDFSTYNGSSDYFLFANFFVLHPLIILYALLSPGGSAQDVGQFLALLIALHLFLACYFSILLLRRYFNFEFWPSVFAATGFAFSSNLMSGISQPQFVFVTTMLPVMAYGALRFAEAPSLPQLILASIPVVFALMGGFVPLAVASLGFSILLVVTKLVLLPGDSSLPEQQRFRSVLVASGPYLLSAFVISPYYFAVYQHLLESISANTASLFYSAHQLAQLPHSILSFLNARLMLPGPFFEFSFAGTSLVLAIALLFVFSAKVRQQITSREWKLMEIGLAVGLLLTLATFGDYSALSDAFYYYLPQIGGMHIYQRFLLLGQFFGVVMLAIILRAIVVARPHASTNVLMAVLGSALVMVSVMLAWRPEAALAAGLNQYVAFDLLVGIGFLASLLFNGKLIVYSLAIVLSLLSPLDRLFDLSRGSNTGVEQTRLLPMTLNHEEQERFRDYLNRFSNKEIIKYVDTTLLWDKNGREPFPKSLAYQYLTSPRLSSYHGFDFRLGPRAAYLKKMPMAVRDGTWYLNPNWETVAAANADFLVAMEADLQSGTMHWLASQSAPEDIYKFPNGVVAVPLKPWNKALNLDPAGTFDNGVFRISAVPAGTPQFTNLALGKSIIQSSTLGERVAGNATDGNTAGSDADGAITHTNADANSWLEVDLGSVNSIDSVKIWNVTGCCGYRLRDYWVFVSSTPFKSTDTAEDLRKRPDVWGRMGFTPMPTTTFRTGGIEGRYVRIQLGGRQPQAEAFLHIAELEVMGVAQYAGGTTSSLASAAQIRVIDFETNFANFHRIQWESEASTVVQYLFSENPRLNFYLNGKRITPGERNGLLTVEAPIGKNTLELRYRHWPLTMFWVMFFGYAVSVLGCLGALAYSRVRAALRYRPN
jgi:hypothetical protein